MTRWLYLLFNFWLFTTMDIVITLPIFRPKSRKIGNVMTKFSTMLNKPSNNWPKWRNFTKSVHSVSNRHWWVSIVNYSAVRFVFHLLVGTHCTLFLCSVRWKYGWWMYGWWTYTRTLIWKLSLKKQRIICAYPGLSFVPDFI